MRMLFPLSRAVSMVAIAQAMGACSSDTASDPKDAGGTTDASDAVEHESVDVTVDVTVDAVLEADVEPRDGDHEADAEPVLGPELIKLADLWGSVHGACARDDGRVYLSDSYGDLGQASRVYWLDPPYDGNPQPTAITGNVLAGLLCEQDALWVCDVGGETVRRFDQNLEVQETWTGVPNPWNVQRYDGERLFVVGYLGLHAIGPSGEVTHLFSGLVNAFDLVVMEGMGQLWVSEQGPTGTQGGGVTLFDVEGSPLKTVKYDWMNPEGMALDGKGDLWVAETATGEVLRVDGTSGEAEVVFKGLKLPAVLSPFTGDDVLLVTVIQDPGMYRIRVSSFR